MYVKVYTFGIEMSQGIQFWYKSLWKCWFMAKKNHFFGKKKSWTGYKSQFWVENAEIC